MIECQFRQRVDIKPARLGGVIRSHSFSMTSIDEANEHDAHRMTARVAGGVAKRAKLLDNDIRDAGLFLQFPQGPDFGRLTVIDETAGKGPTALVRRITSLNQQYL